MTVEVGFIGLGIMGSRMCRSLLKAGFSPIVYDANPLAVAAMAEKGATPAASPREVAQQVDVVSLSLPDTPQVEAVALGDDGIAAGCRNGLVVVDHSTVAPATPQRMADEFRSRGVDWLDAPVSGGPAGAEAASLTIMVGGDENALTRCRPVLDAIGGRVEYMGASGMGATTKIVNQLACGVEMLAMFEAFSVGVAAGIDAKRLWEVLNTSTSRCWIMDDLIPAVVLQNKFDTPRFALRLLHKDIRIAAETAQSLRVPAAATALAEQMYALAEGLGWGDQDQMAVIKLYGQACGIQEW